MDNEKKYIFDNPKNVKRILTVLYGCCALLFALDFVIHRHVIHSWENLWGFYPLYGFVGCVVLVLVATWMRTFLMRPKDYYANEGKTELDDKSDTKKISGIDSKNNNEIGGSDVDA